MRLAPTVLLVVASLVASPAEAKWTQIRSANFTFIGDAPEGAIRRIAQRLEQFREVMLRALPGATAASPVPTVVMVFANQRALQPTAPLFNGNPIELGGYFRSGEDLNYIAVDAEYVDQALLSIFHEYAHFLVTNTMGPVPVWASEGLAEVYEMVQERDGGKKAMVGLAPQRHVELLKASTLIPIRELMTIDQTSSVYNEGNRRSVLYAQSWALVHYLSFGDPQRMKQFGQYLASIRSGSPGVEAFTEAFGDPAALDRELFAYVRKFLFPAIMFDFGERVAAAAVQKGQTIADADAAVYVADLQGRVGREDESRARLAAIITQNPKAARAHAAIGLQHLRASQMDQALTRLEQAAALGMTDGWVQNAYGRALVAQLNSDSSDTLAKARTVLARAVELDANSAFAAAMLGYVELLLGNDADRAASLLERAVRLAPSREQYRVFLAHAYLRQRDFAKASNYLGPLMARGRDPRIREQARDLLGRVAEMRTQPAAATPAPVAPSAQELAALTSVSRAEGTSPPSAPPGTRRPAPAFRPDFRPVGEGETRARGQFIAIECGAGGTILIVQAEAGLLRLRAKQLTDVDFISYRADTPGSVSCGALPTPQWVLATYRAGAEGTGASSTTGDAVAIELLPDGYEP